MSTKSKFTMVDDAQSAAPVKGLFLLSFLNVRHLYGMTWKALCLSLAFGLFFSASSADAFQIKHVQSVRVSLNEEETQQSVNLPEPVDWTKTLLLNYQASSPLAESAQAYKKIRYGGEGDGQSAIFPETPSRVVYRRGLSYKPVNARLEGVLYAIEFKEGVRIHRGITRFDPEVYAKNIKIPTVDDTRAVPLLMVLSSDPMTNQTESFFFKATFTNYETLRIERATLPAQGRRYAQAYADVYWQVIEFDESVTVRSGELRMINSKATMTKVLPGLPLKNENSAALIFNYTVDGKVRGDDGQIFLRGYIENKEALRFSRARAGNKGRGININLVWYLLEFKEGTSSQKGTVDFEAGETVKEISLQPTALCCSIPLVTAASMPAAEGEEPAYDAERFGDHLMTAELLNPETLRLSRSDASDYQEGRVQAEWQVIEFAPFHMLTPKAGEVLRVGEPYDFMWSHAEGLNSFQSVSGAGHADFEMVYPAEGQTVKTLPLVLNWPIGERAFRMTMPPEIVGKKTAGYPLRVRMSDRRKNPKTSLSPGSFAIKGRLKILEPMGGAVWQRDGASNWIRWRAEGIAGDVAIYYDTNSGKGESAFNRSHFISKVAAGADPVVSYLWDDMPDIFSKKVRLKVVEAADPTVFSVSKFDFTVYPKISITQPKADETGWQAHTQRTVSWQTNGRVKSFNLLFRTGDDQTWQKAISDIPGGAAGIYSADWKIPGEASGPATQLKIESAANGRVFGSYPEKGNVFSVGPWIRLEGLPAEGTQFQNLDTFEVRWTFSGAIGLVMVEYSVDSGRSWIKQAVAEASEGIYAWNFISLQAEKVLVRVSDLEHADVRSTSNVAFAVEP